MSPATLRIGYISDGIFKALLGLTGLILSPLLVGHWDAPAWLLCLAATSVLISAVSEIAYGLRVTDASHIKYLVTYDTGWVLISIVAALSVATGSGHAWDLWLGYQLLVSPVIAVVFGLSARRHRRPDKGSTKDSRAARSAPDR